MATTLRDLLIQRAARLQERPALTTPDWGTLSYTQLRNRVEGVALGLLAEEPPGSLFCATGTAWDWVAELAVAASGLAWDRAGQALPAEILGGPRFNAEGGRGPYHAREQTVQATTAFTLGLEHGELIARLRRLNVQLGWDHTTQVDLPYPSLHTPALRAALWSALYAGAHAILEPPAPSPSGFLWRIRTGAPTWDPNPFLQVWDPPPAAS